MTDTDPEFPHNFPDVLIVWLDENESRSLTHFWIFNPLDTASIKNSHLDLHQRGRGYQLGRVNAAPAHRRTPARID